MVTAREMAIAEAQRAGIDPNLFTSVINQESRFNPNAVSAAGARGLAQVMPDTWAQPGFGVAPGVGDPANPQENLRFGADYLKAMIDRYPGDTNRALAAYNWGARNADKWSGNIADLPTETQGYIDNIAGIGGDVPGAAITGNDELLGSAGGDDLAAAAVGPSPSAPTGGASIMEEPDEQSGDRDALQVGSAMQYLGAAMAASSTGKSAAQDFARIQQQYYGRVDKDDTDAQKARQRAALGEMLRNDPEAYAAWEAGASEEMLMKYLLTEQKQEFAANESALSRDQDWRKFSANLNQGEYQFLMTNKLAREKFIETQKQNEIKVSQWDETANMDKTKALEDTRRWDAEWGIEQQKYQEEVLRTGNVGAAGKRAVVAAYTKAGLPKEAAEYAAMPDDAFADASMVKQINDIVSAPATNDARTAQMKNHDEYRKMLGMAEAARESGDVETAKLLTDEANQFMGLVNKSYAQGARADTEYVKSDVRRIEAAAKEAEGFTTAINLLDEMERALDGYESATGKPLPTGEFFLQNQDVFDYLNNLGVFPEGFSQAQFARQGIDKFATYLSTLVKTPGSISNFEQQMFKRFVPGVGSPTEQLREYVKLYRNGMQRSKARVQWVGQTIRDSTNTGEPKGFDEVAGMWEKKVAAGDPDTLPMYLNADEFTPENSQAFMAKKPLEIGQQIYFDGRYITIKGANTIEAAINYVNTKDEE